MNTPRPIPPQYAQPEQDPPPPGAAFKRQNAASIQPGDLIMVGADIYRVNMRYADPQSPRIVFVLYPVLGGLIIRQGFFPREWLPSVLQDNEADTKPMQPVG